jgi:hypothetical protein
VTDPDTARVLFPSSYTDNGPAAAPPAPQQARAERSTAEIMFPSSYAPDARQESQERPAPARPKTPPATEQPAPAAPGGQGEPSTQDVLYDLPEQDEGDRFVDYGEVDLSDGEAQQIGEAFVAAGVGHTLAGD